MEHDYSNQTGLDPFLREPKKKKRGMGAGVFLGFVLGLVTAALVVIGTAFFLPPLLAARLENPAQNTGLFINLINFLFHPLC